MLGKLRREMTADAVLLLAHVPQPPPGFTPAGEHGVVRAWRRAAPDPGGPASH